MTNLEKTLAGLEFARNFFKARADMATPGSDGHLLLLGSMKACANAAELLKAQEARLVHVTAEINYRKIGECPTCGKMINSGDYPNYCGCCGQVVKWK